MGLSPHDKPATILEETPKVSIGNVEPRIIIPTSAPTCPRDFSVTPEPGRYISEENSDLKHCTESNCRMGVYVSRVGSVKRICSYCESEEKE